MKKAQIQDPLPANDKLSPLLFEKYDFSKIIKGMNFWEQLVRTFLIFLKNKELKTFYFSCGLKQISKELIKYPNYYNPITKELESGFAQLLFRLTKSLSKIMPIFQMTIINPDIKKLAIQDEPLILEMIFHTLYTKTNITEYPFIFEQLVQDSTHDTLSEIRQQKNQKINDYLKNITQKEFDIIDAKYTDFVYFSRIFDIALIDFVRRFNSNINLDDNPTVNSWTPVTIRALTYYLEVLYLVISNINIQQEDIKIILLLNNIKEQLYPKDDIISDETIQENWKNIVSIINILKGDDCLLKLLCLSTQNPCMKIENIRHSFTLKEQFEKVLRTRVMGITISLAQEMLINNMKEIINQALPNTPEHLQGVGVYTIEYSEKMRNINGTSFPYIFIIVMIQQFISKYFNTWLKGFLSLISINVRFTNTIDIEKLEKLYKNLIKFSTKFDKFHNDIKTTSPLGVRLLRLLNAKNISNGDKQLLKMFVDSINRQASILSEEFLNIFEILHEFINKLKKELETNSQEYILNIGSVKNILGSQAITRITDLYNFCGYVQELLDISSKNDINNIIEE